MADKFAYNRIDWETATLAERRKAKKAYRKRKYSAWENEDVNPVKLCKGAEIDSSVYEISENRYITLLLKGLIVYCITAGGIGSYMTALEIDFNQIVFNLIILSTALLCAALYHSWKSENLGYLGFFAVYASFIFLFRTYVNSGFYAILNDTIDWASIYFDTEGLQYYNERIANRYVAITIAVTILGVALNVLLNNYILRNARYIVAIVLGVSVNITAFYMQMEPDTVYTLILLFGIAMTFVLKSGKHYKLSRKDHIFKKENRGLTYTLDFKSLWQGMVFIGAFVLVMVGAMNVIYDKTAYDHQQQPSEEKTASREQFQNLIMLGPFGLFDYYPNNGGLSTGELGGVSSIRLDYQTDIRVLYTPFSRDTLYIRNFIGTTYAPYKNKWNNDIGSDSYESMFQNQYANEASALKKAYEEGNPSSAKGYMTITNVESPALAYEPYYNEGNRKPVFVRRSETYTYYPRLTGNDTEVSNNKLSDAEKEMYLDVSKMNQPAIQDFIDEAGIKPGNATDVAKQIRDYYQENVPYTIRPGSTPWRQDFINYFLTTNKKGYCAHFASAAVLVLREMGIPARYCEGYAISWVQIVDDGEIVETEKYSDRYDGYNELGETAVVRVDATDADAHAWVEVFDERYGWTPVEVTPSSGLEEEDDDNFWDAFNNLFGDGDAAETERDTNANANIDLSGADRFMKVVALVVLALMGVAILVFIGSKFYPEVKYRRDYRKANSSDKIILKYARFIKRRSKKDAALRKCMNYSEQMEHLLPYSESNRVRMIDILERAGFSNKEIDSDDYIFADEQIDNMIKNGKST